MLHPSHFLKRKTAGVSGGVPAFPATLVSSTKQGGVALIIVLAFVTLAAVLVVAFMSNVLNSGIGERAAASETSAAQLAASAVQLVEGTIN